MGKQSKLRELSAMLNIYAMCSYDRNNLPNSFQDYFLQNSEQGLNPGLRNANDYFVPGVRSVEIKQSKSKNILNLLLKPILFLHYRGSRVKDYFVLVV